MKPVQTIACLILFATLCGSASSETLPNILLILADDVGSDAISCYGGQSYPTINIDRLAEEGMLFTHGYAMPVCHPSRISLMTGCYPYRFGPAGERWGDFPKAAEKLTIAHRMKRAGYATAVAGKWQLCLMKDDKLQPRRLGFDQWQLFGWHEGARFHDPFLYENGRLLTDTKGRYGPDMYVEFLINFMREQKAAGKPFFAYYSMALCHAVTDDLKNEYVTFASDNRWMTYGEMVASMDDMVGRLMSALDEMQIAENTLVIFTTDNGTSSRSYLYVDETGKMIKPPVVSVRNNEVVPGGKGKHDDTGTRVPLIARFPNGIKAGSRTDVMADLTDLLPTLSEVAGIKGLDDQLDGISFAPVLFGGKRERTRPWVLSEHRGKRSVRSLNWRVYDDGRSFDVRNDPRELSAINEERLSTAAKAEIAELKSVLRSAEIKFGPR